MNQPLLHSSKTSQKAVYRYAFNGKEKDDEITGNSGDSYDFGARMYDTRLGRWKSMDKYASTFSSTSPYAYCDNAPIVFIDPTGEFVVDPTLKAEFPTVALILENADKLYNGQELPPDLAKALEGVDIQKIFNEDFRAALETYSTLSNQSIQTALAPGQGPMISAADLDVDHAVNGKTLCQTDDQGNLVPGTNEQIKDESGNLVADGHLQINRYIVEVLEYELGGDPQTWGGSGFGGHERDSKDKAEAFDAFASTLFHEFVHYGRNQSGAGNSMPVGPNGESADYGQRFEIAVWGKNIGRIFKDWLMTPTGTRPERNVPIFIQQLENESDSEAPVETPAGK